MLLMLVGSRARLHSTILMYHYQHACLYGCVRQSAITFGKRGRLRAGGPEESPSTELPRRMEVEFFKVDYGTPLHKRKWVTWKYAGARWTRHGGAGIMVAASA